MLVGNTVYAAALWGIIVVLARLAGPEEVGKFNLALAITAPVFILFNLQLRALQATDATGAFDFSVYFSLRAVGALASLLLCLGIAAVLNVPGDTRIVIIALAFMRVFQALEDVVHGLFQQREEMYRIAIARVVKGLAYLAAVATALSLTDSLENAAWSYAAVALIGWVLLDMRWARRVVDVRWRWRSQESMRLFLTALPLGIGMMLVTLNANIAIYFLSAMHGDAAAGIYSAINYVGVAGATVVGALAQASGPRLARLYARGNHGAFRGLLLRLVGLGLVLGAAAAAVALLLGEEVLALLYGQEYAAHAALFALLMVAHGVTWGSRFTGLALTAKRNLRVMVPINVFTVAVNVALCWFLIPDHQMAGAAYAFAGASLVKLCVNYRVAMVR